MDFFSKSEQISLVLASKSPRRRFLLEGIGLIPILRPVEVDETPLQGETAADCAIRLAAAKAQAAPISEKEVLLAADTLVALDGEPLGKPQDAENAREILGRLSGRWHEVVTAVALRTPRACRTAAVTTRVEFRRLNAAEIDAYVRTGEPLDKAGAYGIQGHGGALVKRLEGDYANVVGLPIHAVLNLAKEMR